MISLAYQKIKRVIGLFLFSFAVCFTGLVSADDGDAVTLIIKEAERDGNKLVGKAVLSEEAGKHEFKLYDTTNNKNLLLKRKKTKDKTFKFEIEFENNEVSCQIKVTVDKPELEETAKVSGCNSEEDMPPPPAPEPAPVLISGDYTLLAANDLGMHCADLDYQIFSILPPFNVVHAQLVKKGTANTLPQIVTDDGIEAVYTATADATGSINSTGVDNNNNDKTNFWSQSETLVPFRKDAAGNVELGTTPGVFNTWGGLEYSLLYPSVLAAGLLPQNIYDAIGLPVDLLTLCIDPSMPAGCPSILNLFEPIGFDVGIPVPDLEKLALGELVTTQQQMPGPANVAQLFARFDTAVQFFTGFDFGFELEHRNWFAADGIPILPVDNSGNPMSYPLLDVAARDVATGATLASLKVVTPVASEADCQNCHVDPMDCEQTTQSTGMQMSCIGAAVTQTNFTLMTLDQNPPGATDLERLINTAKINILRLHDVKHGNQYTAADGAVRSCDPNNDPDKHCLDSRRAVQCSQCHYSPALDLVQSGPVDEPEQGVNGRQQTRHITMSSAMHRHHGALQYDQGDGKGLQPLFPAMPEPNTPERALVDAEQILNETCYQCHPGKRTQCLRGAMFSGGVVCQDCHGDMEQVGNDFSITAASSEQPFPGNFVLDGSLRVPWASEPACQSCHTGDAVNKNHPVNAIVADDGIRLLQAYLTDNINVPGVAEPVKVANVIKSPTSTFAENQALNSNGQTVDVLYRLSTGHGGVMCEGCHNSTHAIWPNAMQNANDNVASDQLQGHHGTLIECTTCHGNNSFDIDQFKGNLDANGQMKGPHGMHPVNDPIWNEKHKEVDKDSGRSTCKSCHGSDGLGTVLSRVADDRTLECKEDNWGSCQGKTLNLVKGDIVSCILCHENEINDD